MDKLNMHTPNLADENYAKLAALFPNAVTESIDPETSEVVRAIDKDVLMQEINTHVVEGREERYQFTWPDKRKAVLAANAPISAALRPVRADSVGKDGTPGGWDSENLYIEGDNLDVLKLLRETYLGKVKMIYIDPPYNTGKDFIFKDNFSEDMDSYMSHSGQYDEEGNCLVQNLESNGRFHTDWLNMMYSRLRAAKDLLADDGVIFISIDDNEVTNMQKICFEIFGRENFVANLVWEKKKKGAFLSKKLTSIKEYVLVFCRNISMFQGLVGEINSETETYPCINATNKRSIRKIPAGIESKYKEQNYFLQKGSKISDTTMDLVLHSDLEIQNGILAKDLLVEGNWRYTQSNLMAFAENKELYITRDLYFRRIVTQTRYKALKDILFRVGEDSDTTFTRKIDYDNLATSGWGSNEDADEELRLLLGIQKLMDYPKPVKLILKLIASYRQNDYIILDFFSGSATTAHAVMQLNAEDDGHRKFIMVQLPETCDEKSEAYKAGYKNICEIGKERIRRAGRKIKEACKPKPLMSVYCFDPNDPNYGKKQSEVTSEGKPCPDIGFRVLRLDSSNMQDVYYNPAALTQSMLDMTTDNIKPDRTPEDLLFQVMLELGVPLSSEIAETTIDGHKVFDVADGFLLACFDAGVTTETVTAIAKRQPYYAVFRDSSLQSDSVAANFEQIFETYSPSTVRKVL